MDLLLRRACIFRSSPLRRRDKRKRGVGWMEEGRVPRARRCPYWGCRLRLGVSPSEREGSRRPPLHPSCHPPRVRPPAGATSRRSSVGARRAASACVGRSVLCPRVCDQFFPRLQTRQSLRMPAGDMDEDATTRQPPPLPRIMSPLGATDPARGDGGEE